MRKKINKFSFPSIYSVSMGEIAFLALKLNIQMENWIYWSFFFSLGKTWGSEISAKFSVLSIHLIDITLTKASVICPAFNAASEKVSNTGGGISPITMVGVAFREVNNLRVWGMPPHTERIWRIWPHCSPVHCNNK